MTTITAPATITIRTSRTETADVQVGDFLSESLVTDTIVYEVIKVTAKSVTLRSTIAGAKVHEDKHCDKGAYGLSVVWQERVSNENGYTLTLRLRKDGSLRSGSHAGAFPLYPAHTENGKPVSRCDNRF